MINLFRDIAVRVATDSFYFDKIHGDLVEEHTTLEGDWGTWRVKHEELHEYCETADVYREDINDDVSPYPSVYDSITRHKTVYLSGPGGCEKTTRVIDLFGKNSNMIVLTPTHHLAREMKSRGVDACTYHIFFRWSGDKWTPDRMGTKHIRDVVMWDEICTISSDTLKTFLEWMLTKNTTVIMCGDHGQSPPIIGESPHRWLKNFVGYYEEINTDHRSLDEKLSSLKSAIRLQLDHIQCKITRKMIPETPIDDFWDMWKPTDLVVASRKKIRDHLQLILFNIHRVKLPMELVPLCYRPEDTRRQSILVDIPGCLAESSPEQQQLVLNDIVYVYISVVEEALHANKSPLVVEYAMTLHSSQGLTITDTILYIVDNSIEWSNVVYLSVSRVRRINNFGELLFETTWW